MPGNGSKPGQMNPSSQGPSFVAEVSSNHHRDLERCLEFIRTAAGIGCDAVKFQLFRVRELFAPEALRNDPKLLARESWELPVEFLPDLARGCHEAAVHLSI
jgi:sialic acid synthase SpsE